MLIVGFRFNITVPKQAKGADFMASILKRKDSYFIMVSVGYDSDGKQIRKTMNWRPEEGMTEKQIEKACFLQEKFPHFCKNFSPGTGGEILCQPQQL